MQAALLSFRPLTSILTGFDLVPVAGNICNMYVPRSDGVGRVWESVMIVYSRRNKSSLSASGERGSSRRYDWSAGLLASKNTRCS